MGEIRLDFGPLLEADRLRPLGRADREELRHGNDIAAELLTTCDSLELPQLLERIQPDVRIRADAERDPVLADAGDGEEAFARVRQGTYDAVVCDFKMPRVDGMMLYRAIAAATPTLARRVIFVTGDVAGTDAERFLEESGCRWLSNRQLSLPCLGRAR